MYFKLIYRYIVELVLCNKKMKQTFVWYFTVSIYAQKLEYRPTKKVLIFRTGLSYFEVNKNYSPFGSSVAGASSVVASGAASSATSALGAAVLLLPRRVVFFSSLASASLP